MAMPTSPERAAKPIGLTGDGEALTNIPSVPDGASTAGAAGVGVAWSG